MDRRKNLSVSNGQQGEGEDPFQDFECDLEEKKSSSVSPGIFKVVKMKDTDMKKTNGDPIALQSYQKDTNKVVRRMSSQFQDDDDSSDSDCDRSNFHSIFRSLTVNQQQQTTTPESTGAVIDVNSSSTPANDSSGGASGFSTGSTDSSVGGNSHHHQKKPQPDFSSIYYPKTNDNHNGESIIGRGRGRGRGGGIRGRVIGRGIGRGIGRLSSQCQPSSASASTIFSKSRKELASTQSRFLLDLDSDDSEPEVAIIENKTKERPRISANLLLSEALPVKIIDRPEKITSHKESTPLDFPGKLLTRGPLLMSPLGAINHFVHYKLLEKGIKNYGLTEFNSVQKSVSQHFLRGDDCVITGAVNSGKSLSYLIPLIGKLLAESTTPHTAPNPRGNFSKPLGQNKHDHQPVAIIVCSDKRSAIKIDGHLFHMLSIGNQRQLSYAYLCEGKDRRNVHKDVDILITSVHYFSNTLKHSAMYLGYEKLRFFVFEDVDILLRAFRSEFDHIQDTLVNVAAKHSRYGIQRVFCGKDWCKEVEDLYMSLGSLNESHVSSVPTLFINSPNQAIKYSEMKWFVHHCPENEKMDLLSTLLKVDLYEQKAVFIMCSTAEVAKTVHQSLKNNDIYACLAETDTMTQATISLAKNEWDDSDQRIMVLNDEMLRGLNILDVTCLINYDMPSSRAAFIKSSTGADRFACMWTQFRDIAKEKVDPNAKLQRQELQAHFLLTGNESSLYKLKSFIDSMGCEMPDSLTTIANEMEQQAIKKLPICNGIKEFGRCVETVASNCKSRHSFILSELEKESVVPRNGEIEVRISECVNPTTYTAQVLRCYEYKEGKRKLRWSWIQNFNSIRDQLVKHFQIQENRNSPISFEIGSFCAVENSDGIFRARILQIHTRTAFNYPKQLRVFCIDTGNFLQPVADNLFALPSNLQTLPQLAVELILGDLQPMDGANGYATNVIGKARELTLDQILNGRVQFAIGETVWVNPLVDLGRDAVDSSIKTRSSIRLELINRWCAEHNENHLRNILDLCRDTGYKCLELEINNPMKDLSLMSKFHDIGDDYHWAFTSIAHIDKPETVEIFTSFTKNPYCIFGTHAKFITQLELLNKELNDTVIEMINSEPCSDYAVQFCSYYQIGMVVAVKDRMNNNGWCRGLIMAINEDADGGNKSSYDVFLVDMGDEQKESQTNEIFPMLKTFVTKLPFQALAFELSHIKPNNNNDDKNWSSETIDELLNLTLDENDHSVLLDVVALQTKKDDSRPCRSYGGFLICGSGYEIGEVLVEKGLASFVKDDIDVKLVKKNLLISLNHFYDRQYDELGPDEEDESGDVVNGAVGVDDNSFDSDNEWDIVGYDQQEQEVNINVLGHGIGKSLLPSSSSKVNETNNELKSTAPDTVSPGPLLLDGEDEDSLKQIGDSNIVKLKSTPTLKHPDVLWQQTLTEFILKVQLADIRDYTIDVNMKTITFCTNDPPDYGFDIECFGRIEKEPMNILCTGQYLQMTFKKRTEWLWQRPLSQPHKFRWLKEDIDHLQDFDAAEEDYRHIGNNHPTFALPPPADETNFVNNDDDTDSEIDELD